MFYLFHDIFLLLHEKSFFSPCSCRLDIKDTGKRSQPDHGKVQYPHGPITAQEFIFSLLRKSTPPQNPPISSREIVVRRR